MAVALTLGNLNLIDKNGSPFGVELLAEGTDFGSPEPVEVVLNSLLQDGDLVVHTRDGNREQALRIIIKAPDSAALAQGEAALMAELGKRNTLTYTPPDRWGPPTVFDVVTSSLQQIPDDLAEVRRSERHYSVRVVSAPFGRSQEEVTAAALAASGTTTTLVNDGSATTNWTGAINGGAVSPTVDSGAVKVTNGAAVTGTVVASLTLTTSITTSSTKLLVVDWKPESMKGDPGLRAYGDGVELERMGDAASPTAGFTRSWFYVAASSIAVLRLDSTSDIPAAWVGSNPAAVRSLYVDNINRTDIRPSLGTARQLLRSVEVAGSARTQGSLAIEHETSALGDVYAYVYPDTPDVLGYSPPLRQYRVAGGPTVTPDSSLVSGAREDLTTGTATFDIPVRNLPQGTYILAVRTNTGGLLSPTPQLNWTVSTRLNGTTLGPVESGSWPITSSTLAYFLWPVAHVMLPTVDMDTGASTAVVRVTLSITAPAAVDFDEAWLFNTQIGQLLQVSCGTGSPASGGPARRLFIEPPTLIRPLPAIRIGHAADRSDAYSPTGNAIASWMVPEFEPPRVNVFTVTTNALDAAVTLRHFPRWHTNAGEVA
jgi:hypothetical protein